MTCFFEINNKGYQRFITHNAEKTTKQQKKDKKNQESQ